MKQQQSVSVNYQITIIGILFFIFGFITWANSSLIPYFKIACELGEGAQSFYVASAFFAAYFFMAIPSSYILKFTGFKRGMSLGLFVMGIGCLLFIPAAHARSYNLFLIGLFIIGSGLALLQTASNPYVTVLGPLERAAQRISIMGICNKIAGIIAVYVLGSITLKNADVIKEKLLTLSEAEKNIELNALISRVIQPYTLLAAILFFLAIIIFFINMPEIREDETATESTENKQTSIFNFPYLFLGALAIFFYVGVEVISYDSFTNFGEFLGYKLEVARNFPTYTGYALLAGYIFNIVTIPRYISQQKALLVLTLLSIILVFLTILTKGQTAVVCFLLLGFSNAVMWPAIWPLAIEGLGKYTKLGSALLIMGIVGGAILPPLYGKFSEFLNNKQTAYIIMIPAYLYILFYALTGHKLGKQKR